MTFGFEALDLLGRVEDALRGMTLAAQAGAMVCVDCGPDACSILQLYEGYEGNNHAKRNRWWEEEIGTFW